MDGSSDCLEFYAQPFGLSHAGRHQGTLIKLPVERKQLAEVIHGVLIHQSWTPNYGVSPGDDRLDGPHLRATGDLIDEILRLSDEPLVFPREPALRALCCCRHYAVLAVAAFRAHGIPARARCGFGMYFERGKGVDHWVAEVYEHRRWVVADFQIDNLQRRILRLNFDVLDQPAGKFLSAGAAWTLCRSGHAKAEDFGLGEEAGLWFIAMNIARDIAALRKREMLPWDDWGDLVDDDANLTPEALARFDELARLTVSPDQTFQELAAVYASQHGLAVPPMVFNAARRSIETVDVD